MAEIVEAFPRKTRAGRPSKYPLEEWFDGKIRKLSRPADFDSEPKNFRVTVQEKARRKFHGKAITQLGDDGKSIYVQFVKE